MVIEENDEEWFSNYEEQTIYQLQSLLHQKEGLENKPILEIASKLEDLIYQQTLKQFSLSATACIWTKREYIQYYIDITDKLISQCKNKSSLNWKKLFEDSEKNPSNILKQIMKEDDGKKKGGGGGAGGGGGGPNKVPKVKAEAKDGSSIISGGTGAGGGKAKGAKAGGGAVKVKTEGKGGGGAKGGKKKGANAAAPKEEEMTMSLDAAMDDINMFAGPTNTEAFDDNLFGNDDVDLFGEGELDLFPFGSTDDDPLKF